jgi:uncharacterized protein with GYD domain
MTAEPPGCSIDEVHGKALTHGVRPFRPDTKEGGRDMPRYLIEVSYSQQSVQSMVANAPDRIAAVKKLMTAIGGKLESFYYCFGKYDCVLITEMPDNVSAAAVGLAVAQTGSVTRYETRTLLTPEEGREAMRKAKEIAGSYTPPAEAR